MSALLRALERRGRALMALMEPAALRAALGSFEQGLSVDPSHAGLRAGHEQATRALQQHLHAGGNGARCAGARHERADQLRISMHAYAVVRVCKVLHARTEWASAFLRKP